MKRKPLWIGAFLLCSFVLLSLCFSSLPCLSVAPAQPDILPCLPAQAKVQEVLPSEDLTLDGPYLSQEGILPTGCEVVSAAMVLQYWGMDITAMELAEMLPCASFYEKNGKLYGPDPNEYFVGSPFDSKSYGCYAPVIEQVVSLAAPSLSSRVLYDYSLEELYEEYVCQGIPVLLWCTINMMESYKGTTWLLPDGSSFTWRKNEHCLVLAGKKNGEYICMDPYDSNGQVSIPSGLLEQRYEEMGSQAVVIVPKS